MLLTGGVSEIDVDSPNPGGGEGEAFSQAPPIKNGLLAGQVQETKPAPEHSTNIVFVAGPVAPSAPSAPGVQDGSSMTIDAEVSYSCSASLRAPRERLQL